jgi:hypothetical protein
MALEGVNDDGGQEKGVRNSEKRYGLDGGPKQ